MHRYTDHRDANPKGLTAQEFAPDSIAASEIKALWEWLCAQLQLSTTAQLQPGTEPDLQPGTVAQSAELDASAQLQLGTTAHVHRRKAS
jgi:hypothetical protein